MIASTFGTVVISVLASFLFYSLAVFFFALSVRRKVMARSLVDKVVVSLSPSDANEIAYDLRKAVKSFMEEKTDGKCIFQGMSGGTPVTVEISIGK